MLFRDYRLPVSAHVLTVVLLFFLAGMTAASHAQSTFETAEEIPLNESVTVTVKDTQTEIWFKFATTSEGTLVLSIVADNSMNYNIHVYDASRTEIGKLTDAGTCASLKLKDLGEGDYSVLIECREGSGDFTITAKFRAPLQKNIAAPEEGGSAHETDSDD
jgi:hypothetical protein